MGNRKKEIIEAHEAKEHDHRTAELVVQQERNLEKTADASAKEKERLIAVSHELCGRIQAAKFVSKFADVSALVWLRKVKESEAYLHMYNVNTWDDYCRYLGLSRSKVDEDLQNLFAFGESFLEAMAQFSLSYRDLRKLRGTIADGTLLLTDNAVEIDGEVIPYDADHRDDLQAALERVIDAKDENLKAQKKLVAQKQKLVDLQSKEIERLEKEVEEGLAHAMKVVSPDENAFIERIEHFRKLLDTLLCQIDPYENNPLPLDATPRMHAAYVETMSYFRRQITRYWQAVRDAYGDPEVDGGGWIPPNERGPRLVTGDTEDGPDNPS